MTNGFLFTANEHLSSLCPVVTFPRGHIKIAVDTINKPFSTMSLSVMVRFNGEQEEFVVPDLPLPTSAEKGAHKVEHKEDGWTLSVRYVKRIRCSGFSVKDFSLSKKVDCLPELAKALCKSMIDVISTRANDDVISTRADDDDIAASIEKRNTAKGLRLIASDIVMGQSDELSREYLETAARSRDCSERSRDSCCRHYEEAQNSGFSKYWRFKRNRAWEKVDCCREKRDSIYPRQVQQVCTCGKQEMQECGNCKVEHARRQA